MNKAKHDMEQIREQVVDAMLKLTVNRRRAGSPTYFALLASSR
jgi:hypothetical protein